MKTAEKLDQIIKEEYKNMNGMLVVQKGNVIFENYYNGHGPDDAFHVVSVTKTIISALIGICIDKGYIKSVDQKVIEFFPEYKRKESEITVRHLLAMTAPYPFVDWQEPLEELCTQPDWYSIHFIEWGTAERLELLNIHLQERMYYQQLSRVQQEKVRVNLRMNSYFSHST
ncbi:hypothetical protein II9_02531 [Bacillus cereus MSX-D12]|nr:hypothetical protein II9_02531 [Bacillus cereus MSX-D12]